MMLATFVTLAFVVAAEEPLYEAKLVFPPEDFHNHSPSIVETPEGDFLACWFHGRGERTDDTGMILGARLKPGAAQWSEPFVMADNRPLPDQNPTMFIDPQGTLWLFWVSSIDNLVRGYFPMYKTSTDYEGEGPPRWDWQSPLWVRPVELEETLSERLDRYTPRGAAGRELTDEQRAALEQRLEERRAAMADLLYQRLGWLPRQPPIVLSDTRMMLPIYSDTFSCSLFAFTEDGGKNWEFSRPLAQRGIQASLVQKENGNIVAFMRASPMVERAESSDGGMTWTNDPIDIRNSGASVAAIGLESGYWLLAVNDAEGGRHVLTGYLSDDEGKTWKWKRSFEKFERGEGAGHYPTLIQASDDSIHIVYTHFDNASFGQRMRTIKHVQFNEAWVMAGDPE